MVSATLTPLIERIVHPDGRVSSFMFTDLKLTGLSTIRFRDASYGLTADRMISQMIQENVRPR